MEFDSSLIGKFEDEAVSFAKEFQINTKENESSNENGESDDMDSEEIHEIFFVKMRKMKIMNHKIALNKSGYTILLQIL